MNPKTLVLLETMQPLMKLPLQSLSLNYLHTCSNASVTVS
jgi:hypothetical protein